MADDLYQVTKVWTCGSATTVYLDTTGGGWETDLSAGTTTWELLYNATIADAGAGTGVNLTGNKAALSANGIPFFGGMKSTFTGGKQATTSRFASGTLEFFLYLTSIPTSDTIFFDMVKHPTSNDGSGGLLLWVEATSGDILYSANQGGTKVHTGLTISVTTETHFFFQINPTWDEWNNTDFTIGLGGSTYRNSTSVVRYPTSTLVLGHCGGIGLAGGAHDTGHGLTGTIRHMRYTDKFVRYPYSGTYTVPTPPFDVISPTLMTVTSDIADYTGPCVSFPPDNGEPVPVTQRWAVTSVSGGTPPYSYQWVDRWRGLLDNATESAVEVDISELRWYTTSSGKSHHIYCLITDAAGVVQRTSEAANVTLTHGGSLINGVIWVPDQTADVGDEAVFTVKHFGWGGRYDTIFRDSDLDVSQDFAVEAGSITGTNNNSNFTTDTGWVSGAYNSVIKADYSVGIGLDFPFEANTAYGALIVPPPFSDGDEGFWRDQIRAQESRETYACYAIVPSEGDYLRGWDAADAFINAPANEGLIAAEFTAAETAVLDDWTRSAYEIGYYAGLLEWDSPSTPVTRTNVMGGRFFGAGLSFYIDFENESAPGTPQFLPEVDEFSRIYNLAYRGAWEGGVTAIFDQDQANPQYTSVRYDESLLISIFDTADYDTYKDAYDAAYEVVWS